MCWASILYCKLTKPNYGNIDGSFFAKNTPEHGTKNKVLTTQTIKYYNVSTQWPDKPFF